MIDNNVDSMCQPNHWSTRNKGIEQACYPVMQLTIQNITVLEPWIPILYKAFSTEVKLGHRLIPIILNKV